LERLIEIHKRKRQNPLLFGILRHAPTEYQKRMSLIVTIRDRPLPLNLYGLVEAVDFGQRDARTATISTHDSCVRSCGQVEHGC
jgi:hypothetical protein